MFDIGSQTPYADLSPEARETLATLIEKRNDHMLATRVLNEMKIRLLRNPNPTPVEEEAIVNYATLIIAPLRRSMITETEVLLKQAVDIDSLKAMLPMLVAAVIGSVNLPLLFATMGQDPDTVNELLTKVRSFIKDGMS